MITYKDLTAGPNFFLMAGPCCIEDEQVALHIAERVAKITERLNIPYIFKGSYRKANRSRVDSFTGIGDIKALKILAKVREEFGCPVVTDIHETQEAAMAAEVMWTSFKYQPSSAVKQTSSRRRLVQVKWLTSRRDNS